MLALLSLQCSPFTLSFILVFLLKHLDMILETEKGIFFIHVCIKLHMKMPVEKWL